MVKAERLGGDCRMLDKSERESKSMKPSKKSSLRGKLVAILG